MKMIIKAATPLIVGIFIAVNSQGQNLFIAGGGNGGEAGGGNIYQFTPNGARIPFASGLSNPSGLAFDKNGNLFVSVGDNSGSYIYKFTTNGVQSTFASGLSNPNPSGLAFDKNGNLFVADGSGNIYQFTTNGVQSTFASGLNPNALAFNKNGNLFVADYSGNIYEFTTNGVQSTFASGLNLNFNALAFDKNGNLFVADGSGNIYQFTTNGAQSTFASGVDTFDLGGLTFDKNGNLFVSYGSGYIYQFTPNGAETIFAFNQPDAWCLAFQETETVLTPPFLSVSIALTLSMQSGSNVVGSVSTTASPTIPKVATKNILNVLASDENLEGNWPSNSFPKTATLALAGNSFIVLNGTNILLNVSDVMSLNTGEPQVTSGKRNLITGLASTSAVNHQLGNIVFDDTFINGGNNLHFYLYGVLSLTTTDTAPANGIYTETKTISSTTVLGDGFSQNVPFTCTGTFSATGKSPLHL